MRALACFALLAGLAAGAAQAQTPGKFIHPADKNHDQRIDKAEWAAAGFPAGDFAKADKNGDGLIDGPEFVAWSQAKPR